MGSIIGVFDANRKSEALKTVMDNLNLSVESMSREMRFGSVYNCGATAPLTSPLPCSSGGTAIAFRANNGAQIIYRLTGTSIDKSVAGSSFTRVTAPEISISDLKFYVLGAAAGDGEQPKVLIKIKGSAGTKAVDRTDFTLQTLVSQRILDN